MTGSGPEGPQDAAIRPYARSLTIAILTSEAKEVGLMSTDIDVGAERLDLGVEELHAIEERYLKRPTALVMGRGGLDPLPLRDALTARGFNVRLCSGPGAMSSCPLTAGRSCQIRDLSDVAIVFMTEAEAASASRRVVKMLCAAHEGRPAIIALEGRVERAVSSGDHTLIGALRSPAEIAEIAGNALSL